MPGNFFCTKCGTRVSQNDTYCPICGNMIDFYAENYAQPVQPTPPPVMPYFPQQQIIQERKRNSTGRTIGIIGSLAVIASVFLPYVSYDVLGFGESMSLIGTGDGIVFLLIALIALVLFCVRSKVITLLVTIGIAFFCFIEYQSTMDVLATIGIWAGLIDKQIGFYLIIVGTVFMGIGAFVNLFED